MHSLNQIAHFLSTRSQELAVGTARIGSYLNWNIAFHRKLVSRAESQDEITGQSESCFFPSNRIQ